MLKKLFSGLTLLTLLSGCSSQPDNRFYGDLLQGKDNDVRIYLVDMEYFFALRWSDEAQFNQVRDQLKKRENLSDNVDFFFSQFFAKIPFYGENWRDHYTDRLVFYVEGPDYISLLNYCDVRTQHGEDVYRSFNLSNGSYLLEIGLTHNKNKIDSDLQVSFHRLTNNDGDANIIGFTIPHTVLTSTE